MFLELDSDQRRWQETVRAVTTEECPPALIRSMVVAGVAPDPQWQMHIELGRTELTDPGEAVELAIVLEKPSGSPIPRPTRQP